MTFTATTNWMKKSLANWFRSRPRIRRGRGGSQVEGCESLEHRVLLSAVAAEVAIEDGRSVDITITDSYGRDELAGERFRGKDLRFIEAGRGRDITITDASSRDELAGERFRGKDLRFIEAGRGRDITITDATARDELAGERFRGRAARR
jgi:hypothetical protein|tara:strand:+ start:1309 stop:1758 length:450 start_codon:yes stop_codon:yes gene_type:complete